MFPRNLGAKRPDEQRSDSREQFYDAPVEVVKTFHPCIRCFDVLMRYFRGMYPMSVAGFGHYNRGCFSMRRITPQSSKL